MLLLLAAVAMHHVSILALAVSAAVAFCFAAGGGIRRGRSVRGTPVHPMLPIWTIAALLAVLIVSTWVASRPAAEVMIERSPFRMATLPLAVLSVGVVILRMLVTSGANRNFVPKRSDRAVVVSACLFMLAVSIYSWITEWPDFFLLRVTLQVWLPGCVMMVLAAELGRAVFSPNPVEDRFS